MIRKLSRCMEKEFYEEYEDMEAGIDQKQALVEESKKVDEIEDFSEAVRFVNDLKKRWRKTGFGESLAEEKLREEFDANIEKVYEKQKALAQKVVDVKEALIKEAEKMNSSAANSLLKFLEEPPGDFLAVLETDAVGRILPTIQSRCQVLHFQELSKEALIHRLQEEQIPLEKSKLLAFLTNSLGKAVEISQDEWFNDAKDLIYQWFVYLQKQDTQAFIYVQKKLVKSFKEKTQQFTGLSVLMFYYQEAQRQAVAKGEYGKVKQINQIIERILIAEQKLRSNVGFQAVAEQFVLQTIF